VWRGSRGRHAARSVQSGSFSNNKISSEIPILKAVEGGRDRREEWYNPFLPPVKQFARKANTWPGTAKRPGAQFADCRVKLKKKREDLGLGLKTFVANLRTRASALQSHVKWEKGRKNREEA